MISIIGKALRARPVRYKIASQFHLPLRQGFGAQAGRLPDVASAKLGAGSIVLLLAIPLTLFPAPRVSLQVYNERGALSNEVAVGKRARVELSVEGDTGKRGWPQIPGLPIDCIAGRQQRHEVSWTNGKQLDKVRFVWDVVFSTQGTYALGPVNYDADDGTRLQASGVTLQVITRADPPAQGVQKSRAFFRWEVERLEPFAGETVPVKLVFYTTDAHVQLESMSEIRIKDADFELSQEGHWSSAMHNGVSYATITWSGVVHVRVPGVVTLPSVALSYRKEQAVVSPWALMQQMFGPATLSHQQRAAACVLTVRPLPPTEHTIIGVGIVREATRSCDVAEMACGSAGTVRSVLVGSVNPAYCVLPELQLQGQALVHHQKAQSKGSFPHYTYEQEYVVQPQEVGILVIPEQALWFFNPDHENYESVTLSRLELVVTPGTALNSVIHPEDVHEQVEIADQGVPEERTDVAPEKAWVPQMPLCVFLVLFFLPVLLALIRAPAFAVLRRGVAWCALKMLVYRTKKSLKRAIEARDGYQLHTVMQHYTHRIMSTSSAHATRGARKNWLIDRGCSPEQVHEWDNLWDALERAAFAPHEVRDYTALGARCLVWVDRGALWVTVGDGGLC